MTGIDLSGSPKDEDSKDDEDEGGRRSKMLCVVIFFGSVPSNAFSIRVCVFRFDSF